MSRKETKTKISPPNNEDPSILLSNYLHCCKNFGIDPSAVVQNALTTAKDVNSNSGRQIILNYTDDRKEACEQRRKLNEKLGQDGCHVLCCAIRGKLDGGKQQGTSINKNADVKKLQQPPTTAAVAYKALKELRIWQGTIGDAGVIAISNLLLLGVPDIQLCFLEVTADDFGPKGALALGRSLCCGMNNTLVTLILDFNRNLGSEGIENLCRGLCTNSTLKKLSVKFCGIDQNGGDPLAEMLLFSKLSLTILELGGNQLGGEGLLRICHGLAQNSSLTNLGLSDNQIWGPRDEKSLSTFAFCVSKHPRLKEINLLYNLIEERGAVALKPAVEGAENQRIEKFLLDANNIPDGLYQQLYRNKVPTKKKVAKKKKKGVKTKK